jgi:hypothetical protein
MKTTLRLLAVVLALAALVWWYAAGMNRGWSKNRVEIKTVDEVTGIEGSRWEDRFVPGVELLAGALGGATILVAASFFFRNRPQSHQHSQSINP